MIKKFAIFIILCSCQIYFAHANEAQDLMQKYLITDHEANLGENINQLIKTAKFFDEKYPKEKIDEDMTEDIETFFPNMSPQQVINFQQNIRELLSIYRHAKNAYEKYKEQLLTPPEAPLIADDNEYVDYDHTPTYIPSNDIVVISDIKTIVPYSGNQRDRKAADAKLLRDSQFANQKGDFDELKYIAARTSLLDIPFYDILLPSPLTGKKGIGEWQKNDGLSVSIITSQTGTKDAPKIQGAIDILIPNNKFIIANDGLYHKPQVAFNGSQNLKNWNLSLPVPTRLSSTDNNDWSIYTHNLAIPLTFEVEDQNSPLILNSEIIIDVCDTNYQCKTEKFTPTLTLQPEYSHQSSVSTFITQQHLKAPSEKNKQIQINSIKINNLPDIGDFIEVKLTAKKKISSFSIFIDTPDNVAFQTPRINIDGKNITAHFLPVTPNTDLQNKIIEISAELNNRYSIRSATLPNIDNHNESSPTLTINLILLAFICGLFLNFSPFVFPLLAMKILSFTQFGARTPDNLQYNLKYTLNGIFTTTLLLAGCLSILKQRGYFLGWGMQFQIIEFVITVFFTLIILIFMINNNLVFNFSSNWQKVIQSAPSKKLKYFFSGTLVIILSIISTVPFLGTTIGFAFTNNISSIFYILFAISLGLATPYILLRLIPVFTFLIPAPGTWIHSLKKLANIMLIIAVVWTIIIIKTQTSGWFTSRLIIYALLFCFCILTNSVNHKIPYIEVNPRDRAHIRRIFNNIFISLAVLLYLITIFDGINACKKHLKISNSQTITINTEEINKLIQEGQSFIININADWCFTCYHNDLQLNSQSITEHLKNHNVKIIKTNFALNHQNILKLMSKYHRGNLPFNILFSPLVPDGIVLPQTLKEYDLKKLISNFTLNQPKS